MAAGGINADGFIRCCKALHLVVHQSISCVDDVLKAWHARQRQTLPWCSRPRPRPPSNPQECKDSGKPKPSSSCSNCVAWGKSVEDVYYPQSKKGTMPWGNVNPLCLPTSPVEVAKAFVLRLQLDKQYTNMEHFDSASVLMIMMHFDVFYGRDQNKFVIIKKVSDARNKLCHMQLEDNLYLDDQQVDDIFSDIDDLIACLETLYPLLFTTQHALDIRIQLSQIKTGPVTAEMKNIFEDFTKSVEEVANQSVKKIQTEIKESEHRLENTVKRVAHQTTQDLLTDIKKKENSLLAEVKRIGTRLQKRFETKFKHLTDRQKELRQDQSVLSQELTHRVDEIPIATCKQLDPKFEQLHARTSQLSRDIQDEHRDLKEEQRVLRQALEQDMHKIPRSLNEQLGPNFKQVHQTIQKEHCKLGRELRLKQEELSQEFREVKETMQADLHKDQSSFDVDACRNQLMEEYRQTRGKLTLLPGMPEECADMDDLYIELDLLEEEKTPTEVKIKRTLKSADELFTLQNKRGAYCKRVLVRGGPGSGKSTTISKLAYDWAYKKEIPGLPYGIDLLFALDLREIRKSPNLIDAMHDQLLSKCSKNKLMSFIESHAKSIVFLLDGFDEATDVLQQGDVKLLLSSKWLQESIVVVTTRINKVAEFVNTYGVYSHIQLTGLSKKHMKEYVLRFLQVQSYSKYIEKNFPYGSEHFCLSNCPTDLKEKGEDIVSFLNNLISSFQGLCQTPLTLSMICMMWSEDKQVLTQKITELYNGAIMHLAQHKRAKYEKTINDESLLEHLNKIMKKIGKVALDGLFQDRLIFSSSEFDELAIENACHFGLLSEERKRSKTSTIQQVTFFHKTFQEYCAALYWSSPVESDKCIFMSYLQKIDSHNVDDMKILLQFCCGSSRKAAEIILPHIVRLSCDMLQSNPLSGMLLPGDSRLDIPTTLLCESGAQHMHTHLLPLFETQSSSLTICFDRFDRLMFDGIHHVSNMDINSFLFFLECVRHDAESLDSFYKGVTEVNIVLGDKSRMDQVFVKLLSCISTLQSLVIEPIAYGIMVNIDLYFNVLVGYDMPCKKVITSLVLKNVRPISAHGLRAMVTFMNQLTSLNTIRFELYLSDIEYILNALDPGKVINELDIQPNDEDDSFTSMNGTLCQSMCQLIPTLHKLTIRSTSDIMTSSSWYEPIFSAFNTVGCQLRLNQASTNRAIRNNAVEKEVDMDKPVNLPCKQLILEEVEITSNDAEKLVEAFNYLGNLQVLSIQWAQITDDMGVMIAKHIHKLYNLEVMNLSGNNIGSNGGSHIVRNLCLIPGLQQLDLGCNPIGVDLDPDSSLWQCLSCLTKLTQLNLENTRLNAGHILQLSTSLTHMPELQVLRLGRNQIGAAMGDLHKSLQHLTKLVHVDLLRTSLSEDDVSHIASCLTRMPDLQTLDLSENQIGSAIGDLCHGLQHLTKLRTLYLYDTDLMDDGIAMLPLTHLTELRELRIDGGNQQYGPQGVEHLFRNLHHVRHLDMLHLNYSKGWHESNAFLRECYQMCDLSSSTSYCGLWLYRERIQSIEKFSETH